MLTFDRDPSSRTPTVEVAHEALLTEWDRLAGWIDDAREDLVARRRLEQATSEWVNADGDTSFLIGGGRLELAEAWAADSGFALTQDERRFLLDSRLKVDREFRSRAKRRRRIVGALVVGLLATTTLAGVALRQANEADTASALADRQRDRAVGAEAQAVAERDRTRIDRMVAESERLVDGQLDLAYLLAVEARRREDTPATRGVLLTTIVHTMPSEPTDVPPARFGGYLPRAQFDPAPTVANRTDQVALSDDGSVLAVVSQYTISYSQAVVYEVATGGVLAHADLAGSAASVDVSADGATVAILSKSADREPGRDSLTLLDVDSGTVRGIEIGAAEWRPDVDTSGHSSASPVTPPRRSPSCPTGRRPYGSCPPAWEHRSWGGPSRSSTCCPTARSPG